MSLKKKFRLFIASTIVSFHMVLLRHGIVTVVRSNWLLNKVPKIYGWKATSIRSSKMEEKAHESEV